MKITIVDSNAQHPGPVLRVRVGKRRDGLFGDVAWCRVAGRLLPEPENDMHTLLVELDGGEQVEFFANYYPDYGKSLECKSALFVPVKGVKMSWHGRLCRGFIEQIA